MKGREDRENMGPGGLEGLDVRKGESRDGGRVGLMTGRRATEGLSAMDGPSLSGRSTGQRSTVRGPTEGRPRSGWQFPTSVTWYCLQINSALLESWSGPLGQVAGLIQLHPCLSPLPPAKLYPVGGKGALNFRVMGRIHVTLGTQCAFRAVLQKDYSQGPWETVPAADTYGLIVLMVPGIATSQELLSHSTSVVLRGSGWVWCGEEVC